MAVQSCNFSTDENALKERLILTFDDEYIFRKFRFRREDIVIISDYTERALRSAIVPVSEIDITVASLSTYTKVLASGNSFQDVCGELIAVVQDRPF